MGLDLISHTLKDTLAEAGGHHSHVHEIHEVRRAGTINFPALASICSTLLSASILQNGARKDKTMQKSSHYLPVSLAILLVIIPLLGIEIPTSIDAALSILYATAMVILGARLCYAVGRMLLMSYNPTDLTALVEEITSDPNVTAVEEAKVWQVHYSLCMANFKLRTRNQHQVDKLRERIATLVKTRLGGGYGDGSKGVRWEISSQITIEK